jgi:hypothetical protein
MVVINLKDTLECRDWVDGVPEPLLIPITVIIRDALADWAASPDLTLPPSAIGHPR